jgi:hypothetical protein
MFLLILFQLTRLEFKVSSRPVFSNVYSTKKIILLGKTPFVFTVSTIEPQLSQEIIPLAISANTLPPKWHSSDANKSSHFPFVQKLSLQSGIRVMPTEFDLWPMATLLSSNMIGLFIGIFYRRPHDGG